MHGSCPNGQRCVLTNNGYQKTCVSGEYIFMTITIMIMITILIMTMAMIVIMITIMTKKITMIIISWTKLDLALVNFVLSV